MVEFSIGDRVSIGGSKFGVIAFIGETKFKSGEWYGIVLDQSEGRNDGSVEGTRYFQCKPKQGLFVRKSKITKLVERYPDSSETETLQRTKKKTIRTYEVPSGSSTQKTSLTVTGKPDKPTFKVGSRISLKDGRLGTLLYIGSTDFKPGTWAGIELDDRCGRHNGCVTGRRYFKCKQMHGVLVPIDKLIQGTINKTPTSTDNVSLTVSTENQQRHNIQYKTSTLLSSDTKSLTVSPESTGPPILDQTPTLKSSDTTSLTVSPDNAFQPVLYQTPVLQSNDTTILNVSPQNTIPTVPAETITLHYTDIKGMTLSPESTEPILIEQTATLQSKINISLAESHQRITSSDTGYSNRELHKYYDKIISDEELDKGVLDYLISSCAMTTEDREEVNREPTRSGRNRIILDILIARPYRICFLFKEALQNGDPNNSELVAELDFTTKCPYKQDEKLDHILEDERTIADYKIRLQKNYKKIVDAIDVTGDICDSLVSESVIKLDDQQEVTAQKNIAESNRCLLFKLIHCSLSAYTTFINILRSDQTYCGLADDIEQTPVTKDDAQRLKIGQLMLKDRQDCRQGHIEYDPIPENRREQTRICLNEWKRENSKFVITSAAKKVCTLIRENNCVTVVGNSGVGKTAAVRNAALELQRNGFIVVPVSTPEEIVNFFNHKRKTLFVTDDLCGRYTLNQKYLDDWKQRLDEIELILEHGRCKIMATCRLQVIQDERFKELSIFQSCECNLNSKELILSAEEKSLFINAYCIEHFSDERIESNTSDFFPLLCSLYQTNKKTDFLKFCSNPFQFYDKELKYLRLQDDTGKYKYCCLFLIVIFNNNLKIDFLSGKIDSKVKKIIKDTLSECELNKGTSPKCLLKSLKTLEGSFLICKDDCYRTIHDKLFDYLAFYFGNKMMHILIDHADSKFIRERLIWATNQTTDTDFTVYIPNKFIDAYIDRVIHDWSEGKVWCVFFNRNMKSSKFTSKLLGHLNQLDLSYQSQLAQKKVNNKLNDNCLLLSCFVSDINLTLWIIKNGGNVNQCRKNGVSPLSISCQEGHIDTVRELIKCGADINKCDITGFTPLTKSSFKGYLHIVKELIQCGADLNKSSDRGISPLYASCLEGHIDTVRELIRHGADINKCNITGMSPLNLSSYKGNLHIVRELIQCNADLNKCNDKGASPLYASCLEGHIETVRELIKYGADINKSDITGSSPLFVSSFKGLTDIVRELIQCNADLNKCNDKGASPLYVSCLEGHIDTVRELIKYGADINKSDITGLSPLILSSQRGHTHIVRELIKCGADINHCHDTGTSSLYVACEIGNIDIVSELVRAEADTNKCQHVGESPLFVATAINRKEIVTLLLQNNTDVNKCANNKEKYCEAIVKYHKMTVDTYMGACRDNIIFKYASPQVKHYIQESLGNQVLDLVVGSSPLHMACFMGHVDIVKLILEKNPNINITKEDGTTPLFLACEFGHGVIVKLMIEKGADDKICRNDGKSPYSIALENDHCEINTLLSRHDKKVCNSRDKN